MKMDIWFALVQVEPINDNKDLGEAKGAYINVAYKAVSKDEFVKIVLNSFKEYNFNFLDFDEVEKAPELVIENIDDSEKILLLEKIEE